MANVESIPIWKTYPYRAPPELKGRAQKKLKTLIVGGGPIGLSMALDLGRRGYEVIVLNALPFIARGSKAICFSKRSLDIWDRLGIGERMVEKGVVWERGKVFWKDNPAPVYTFDLAPVKDQKNPAFINIQQYYIEEYLLDEIERYDNIDIRWRNEVVAVAPRDDGVTVTVGTPDGNYQLDTEYLIACDGNKSPVRTMMGLGFEGRVFEDNFLIADVKFKQARPTERWFRFNPPYPGASSLVHKQPDDVWRLDFQLGRDIDKTEAIKPENVDPFVRGMLGPDVEYEYEWLSVYTFQCRRMARFVHGRVIFAGDAAHLVSPFGARGCNGGLADVDNLGWKLDLVLKGAAPAALLETYNEEAVITADENILNSTRATDFMTPKTTQTKAFRDAVLELAKDYAFARPFVNSGRLSSAVCYPSSSLNAPDSDDFEGGLAPGKPCIDAPVVAHAGDGWLLSHLGEVFTVLMFTDDDAACNALRRGLGAAARVIQIAKTGSASAHRLIDVKGLAHERYGAAQGPQAGAVYFVRPDQYVAGRWRCANEQTLKAAIAQAKAGN